MIVYSTCRNDVMGITGPGTGTGVHLTSFFSPVYHRCVFLHCSSPWLDVLVLTALQYHYHELLVTQLRQSIFPETIKAHVSKTSTVSYSSAGRTTFEKIKVLYSGYRL